MRRSRTPREFSAPSASDYFLSPDAAAGAGALLVEAAAGVDGVDDVLLEEELLLDDEPEEEDDEEPSFFVELYRSEYQPPPLRTKLERLSILVSGPSAPHVAHVAGGGSENFCSTSMIFPQL